MLAELFFGKRIEGFSRWKEKQEKRLNKARKRMSPPTRLKKMCMTELKLEQTRERKKKK